jgi:DNA replication and repair protein RecF
LYIASLQLQNYRNYEETRVDFSDRTNLILGDNGRGKTNLLESIYLLSTSKSFRSAPDQKLVQWGRDGYLVSATFHGEGGIESSVALEYRDHKKILSINGIREKRISDLIGQVFCILLSFEDIALVTGPPYLRRGFLDLVLSTTDPLYFETLKTYLQVIKQKNRYLRDAVVCEEDILNVWNDQLSEAGTYILRKRMELIGFFNYYAVSHAEKLTQFSSPLKLMYRSTIPGTGEDDGEEDLRSRFDETLISRMDAEMRVRRATCGPHRDDFTFYDGESEIRYYGSVGEARISSIVLKLAQGAYYRESKHIMPIILVDDILLELDSRNREHVLSLFGKDNQLLITTTERVRLSERFSTDRVFHIRGEGCIKW